MRTHVLVFIALGAVGAAAAACGSSQDQGTLSILTVDDPFVGPPAATTLNVDGISEDGGVTAIAHGQSAASGTVDLGSLSETAVYALEVTAFDADGGRVAWGETLPFEMGAIADETLPVFVQRTGTLSRMPVALADGRNAPLVGILGGEYVFEAGGTDSAYALTTNLYDLVPWSPFAGPSFTTAPTSLALSDLLALGIAPDGGTWIDLTTDDVSAATLPTGATATWADVAGGQAVLADDGTVYVVGATRQAGGPTSAVLVVSTSQTLSFATLTTARAGASAAWVSGKGLVVVGGNVGGSVPASDAGADSGASGATGAGVEVLASGATQAIALAAYPADTSTGGGVDALDGSHVLVVEGAAALSIDLDCTTSCAPIPWAVTLPETLTFAQVFDIDASSVFVVGEDAAGASHAIRVSTTAATEVPFKLARNHARGVRLPLGQVAIVGGNATMESFVP